MNRRVLYIEDDPDQSSLVQAMLERRLPGVIVEVCCTAAGAESFLNHRCYDVVICDVNLPGELGIDIAEKILERDPDQPIYLMSEYTGSKFKVAAAEIGLDLQRKFSQKDPEEFVADIERMLYQRPCDSAIAMASIGNHAAPDVQHGGNAATRENRDPAERSSESAAELSLRPEKSISLTSPHVRAARASFA